MTRERLLIKVLNEQYGELSAVNMPFPEELYYVGHIGDNEQRIYIAGFPSRDCHEPFDGLSFDVGQNLTNYRLYKFFSPLLLPSGVLVFASTVPEHANGTPPKVITSQSSPVPPALRLDEIGQAQVYWGGGTAVIWECFFDQDGMQRLLWAGELFAIWWEIERAVPAHQFFTENLEPMFDNSGEDYSRFLARLGYSDAPIGFGDWWRWKANSQEVER